MTSAIINASKTAVFKGNRFEKRSTIQRLHHQTNNSKDFFLQDIFFFFIDHKKTLNISFFSAQKLD